MHHNNPEEYLGVDVGDKRIGLARGSSLARLAEPLKIVPADKALDEIGSLARHYRSTAIVIGLPRGLDGQETVQTEKVRSWAKAAKAAIKLPFYWQDEALTSVAADKFSASLGANDAAAASVILQDFLDAPTEQRVRC